MRNLHDIILMSRFVQNRNDSSLHRVPSWMGEKLGNGCENVVEAGLSVFVLRNGARMMEPTHEKSKAS